MEMNAKYILMSASAALLAVSCVEAVVETPEPDVTPVVLAENEMAARLPKMLDLSWSKGDKLTVISGSASQEFTITDDYTTTVAKFRGEPVEGESFTIISSAAGNTLEAVEARSYAVQEQEVDGSTAHINLDMALVGVTSYKDVTFTKEWAEENGGELKMSGCIKLNLELPGQVYTLDGVGVKASRALFYAANSVASATDSLLLDMPATDISVKASKYTAYMATSWQTVNVTEQDKITLWAHNDKLAYFVELPAQNLTIEGGQVYEMSIAAADWQLYDMSPGSVYNPYKIKTKADLLAMPAQLEEGFTRYFQLEADIDLSGETWTPINTNGSAFKEMIFEGNNHKISNLTITSETDYPSFAGILMGSIKNVTFENPVITTSSSLSANSAAVVAATVAYPSGNATSVLENITVTGATLTVSKGYQTTTGLLAGNVINATITNCHTAGNVLHAGANAECNIGGFIGASNGATVSNCSQKGNVEVTATSRVISAFVGSVRKPSSFSGCSVEGNLTAKGLCTYSGLMFGYVSALTTFTDCTAKGTFSGLNGNSGGFVGDVRSTNGCVFDNCDAELTVTNTAGNQNGAFLGHGEATLEIKNCDLKIVFDAGKGQNYGGLVGATSKYAEIRNCHVTGTINIVANADYAGGILGKAHGGGVLIEKCSFDGFIGKDGHNRSGHGGIVGWINCSDVIIRNCWTGGEILGANHGVGGICGTTMPNSTIEYCYSTMTITAGHGIGSIVGRANNNANDVQTSENKSYNNVVRKSIAWSPKLESWKSVNVDGNHSGGAVVGSTVRNNVLEDCYRRSDMTINVYKTEMDAPYDQENANLENTLVWNFVGKYHCPYHGKVAAADATASSVAKTLGWDETIWDLSGTVPVFKK